MSFLASKTNSRRKPAADSYFAVLRYTTLFLYDSEKQLDCRGVIILSNHNVRLYPNNLQEHEVFSRPSCIKLEKKAYSVPSYFLNCERCIEKEDWYFALRRASKLPANKPTEHLEKIQESTHFDQAAMNQLIATIHSDEHHFHTQWLNALLGRVFFAVYKTNVVKQFLYQKVVTKVNKMNEKTPPFLGDIRVRSVHVGQALPYFTQPRLLGMGPSGELTGECNINYAGGFKLEIDTLVKWKYSDRLRPLNLNIVLSLTLNKMKGKVLFKIKEPPTNRLWFGFYEPPDMEWLIEPVVWDKRVGYSLIIKTIEGKLKELVMENMVLPNMDDFPFFPTNSAGGIF
ncbi:putative integral membrane protein conserved region-domain-containing protein, partial [Umbelopsis sp. PMI_123]